MIKIKKKRIKVQKKIDLRANAQVFRRYLDIRMQRISENSSFLFAISNRKTREWRRDTKLD